MSNSNQAEWLLLQQSYDQMERQALWLKVVAIVLWLYLVQNQSGLLLQIGVVLLFWLHEAVWKTLQSRTESRLYALEQATQQAQDIGCLWHHSWQQQRGGPLQLLTDYLKNSIKPTVAVTYLILLGASLVRHFN